MKILFTGSRDASVFMEDIVFHLMRKLAGKKHSIIVGDAAGVDDMVMKAAHKFSIKHTVYGANSTMRRVTPSGKQIALKGDYLSRDRYMASRCDVCIAVWNGVSRGTIYTAKYAAGLNKQVKLYQFFEAYMEERNDL